MPKTVEFETTEAKLLTVALREYLQGDSRSGMRANDHCLRDHATSRSIIEELVKRIDVDGAPNG
jgi:hypothetical protein